MAFFSKFKRAFGFDDNGDELVFDSDCKGTRPHLYSIEKEYGGDVRKALIGKVLFCWSDMQGR